MLTEEAAISKLTHDIKMKIKLALLERDMSQVELSKLIKENPQQMNRAINGDNSPKSIEIRNKIYRVLNI